MKLPATIVLAAFAISVLELRMAAKKIKPFAPRYDIEEFLTTAPMEIVFQVRAHMLNSVLAFYMAWISWASKLGGVM